MCGRLRSCEWALIVFFAYVALISFLFPLSSAVRMAAFAIAVCIAVASCGLAACERSGSSHVSSMVRDWLPVAFTLVAYREMDWFAGPLRTHALEQSWIVWDRWFLQGAGSPIESCGWLGPAFLEFCYLLVYAVGPFVVAILWAYGRRELVDRVLLVYVTGTLLAYALFPYFPSAPPRVVFAGMDLPRTVTALRRFNLWIVGGYGIHSSVFPSAHVSSAFSGAWGLLAYFRERQVVGYAMLLYASAVAVAAVYGRYHYAVDAVAGFAISLAAFAVALIVNRCRRSDVSTARDAKLSTQAR